MTRLTLTYERGLLSVECDEMSAGVIDIVTATIGDNPEDGNDGGPWPFNFARWYARPRDVELVRAALAAAGHNALFEWPAVSAERLAELERQVMDGYEIGVVDAIGLIQMIKGKRT